MFYLARHRIAEPDITRSLYSQLLMFLLGSTLPSFTGHRRLALSMTSAVQGYRTNGTSFLSHGRLLWFVVLRQFLPVEQNAGSSRYRVWLKDER